MCVCVCDPHHMALLSDVVTRRTHISPERSLIRDTTHKVGDDSKRTAKAINFMLANLGRRVSVAIASDAGGLWVAKLEQFFWFVWERFIFYCVINASVSERINDRQPPSRRMNEWLRPFVRPDNVDELLLISNRLVSSRS